MIESFLSGHERRRSDSAGGNWTSDKIGVSYFLSPLGATNGFILLQEHVSVLDPTLIKPREMMSHNFDARVKSNILGRLHPACCHNPSSLVIGI